MSQILDFLQFEPRDIFQIPGIYTFAPKILNFF